MYKEILLALLEKFIRADDECMEMAQYSIDPKTSEGIPRDTSNKNAEEQHNIFCTPKDAEARLIVAIKSFHESGDNTQGVKTQKKGSTIILKIDGLKRAQIYYRSRTCWSACDRKTSEEIHSSLSVFTKEQARRYNVTAE